MSSENDKFKNVLIISEFNLSDNTATDITMRSYFDNWPKDKILILSTMHSNQYYAKTINVQFIFHQKIKKWAKRLLLDKNVKMDNRNLVPGAIINNVKNGMGIKHKIFAIGTAYMDLLYFYIPQKTVKTIDRYNPEVIYTNMGGIRLIRLANKFSKRYGISIVPHFMDDWISTIYTGSLWLKLPRFALLSCFKKLLVNTKVGLGISQKMTKEYEKKFNKRFLSLMNVINIADFKNGSLITNNVTDVIKLTYFGGLHLNRWKSLVVVSEVLGKMTNIVHRDIILEIYTSQENTDKYSSKFNSDNVYFKGLLEHKATCMEMLKTDFLIHVESFDESVIKFTRLSISTKIPEYLASGTPIIAIGPSSIASIEYLKENNCAYVSTSLDAPIIKETILSAINDNKSNKILVNNIRLVELNHSSKQKKMFQELLLNL